MNKLVRIMLGLGIWGVGFYLFPSFVSGLVPAITGMLSGFFVDVPSWVTLFCGALPYLYLLVVTIAGLVLVIASGKQAQIGRQL